MHLVILCLDWGACRHEREGRAWGSRCLPQTRELSCGPPHSSERPGKGVVYISQSIGAKLRVLNRVLLSMREGAGHLVGLLMSILCAQRLEYLVVQR